ncbi:hypothetical protein R50073_34750 [Maricurvus nonylphenolicus]|uniref:ATP-dependent zinc protease family protein n=1 Tax=Maricurvus nonylphenolicus TaxID=1008307 RepID=UPI0036F3DE4E
MSAVKRFFRKGFVLGGIVVLLAGCETITKAPDGTVAAPDCPPVGKVAHIGEVEWVTVAPEAIRQKARIDTGAQTTSIGVIKQQKFERDGDTWIAFTIRNRETGKEVDMKRPLQRTAKIKRHNAESVERYVVMLDLQLGDLNIPTEVTLADREQFEFPVLIGRNFLDGIAVVDVSKKFMALNPEQNNN